MVETTPVLISGAGPVGLVTAYTLAHHGVRCMVIERNASTTAWPKMDITNVRSMEILRRLGIADELREQGVGQDFSFDVIISSGLGDNGQEITRWNLPSPNEWRKMIREQNDGSMPREPYQRCSQAIFEAWLKKKIDANSLISGHWNTKLVDVQEKENGVIATVEDMLTGSRREIEANYLVGCDGGGSMTRRKLNLGLSGGPVPAAMYLVHFQSRDLTRLHKQGQFWHIFFTSGAVIISQDEDNTWTTHLPVPLDFDPASLPPDEQIYRVLGGQGEPYKIKVDRILVSSVWRPNNAIADRYRSPQGRVFLAGDSAHQNIPTGGYGMNTGLGDAYDIAWKLATCLNGAGGEALLNSYESERRPVAIRNVQRAAEHMAVHRHYSGKAIEAGPDAIFGTSEEGEELRSFIKNYVQDHDGENKDHGIEMGYRIRDSPIVWSEPGESEPEWTPRRYIPSTIAGGRPPHVFLTDGDRSIFDLFGEAYTIVDFSKDGSLSDRIEQLAKSARLRVTRVHLPDEEDARQVWERDHVLVRPDHFVAWRSDPAAEYTDDQLSSILAKAFGRQAQASSPENSAHNTAKDQKLSFAGVEHVVDQDKQTVDRLAAFQS